MSPDRQLPTWKCAAAIILSIFPVIGPAAKARAQPTPEPSVLVTVTTVEKRLVRATLRAYGTTQADTDRQASIVIPRQGIVGKVSARLGEIVPAGAALVEVDTAPAASVAYEQAHAALKLAQFEAQRIRDLWNKGLTTHDRYVAVERDLSDAEAKFAAQRQLGTGESRHVLRAPFTGIVNRLAMAAGDRVAADTPALSIVPRDAIVVPLGIEPEDAPKLRPMMKVEIRSVFASSTQSQIPGEIASVQGIVNIARLQAYGLTFAEVATALSANNVLQAVGRIEEHYKLHLALSDTALHTPDNIGRTIIRSGDNGLVELSDIAEVKSATAPQWLRVTADGRDAVSVKIYQQPGGNTVQIVRDVKSRLADFASHLPRTSSSMPGTTKANLSSRPPSACATRYLSGSGSRRWCFSYSCAA